MPKRNVGYLVIDHGGERVSFSEELTEQLLDGVALGDHHIVRVLDGEYELLELIEDDGTQNWTSVEEY